MLNRLVPGCALALSLLVAAPVSGSILLNVTTALANSDPTELSRLSRSGVPSDWSVAKAYPGVINPTISYHYETFTVNVGITPYIQLSIDDPNAAIFVAAFSPTYILGAANYLGDNGSSGNYVGGPSFFQVIAPINTNLVVVVNDVSNVNGGIGKPFNLLVEGFIDTSYDDPIPTTTPEPSVLFLSSSGIGLLTLLYRRNRQSRSTAAATGSSPTATSVNNAARL